MIKKVKERGWVDNRNKLIRKRYVLKCLLKLSVEELSSSGIEFHSLGAATANVLSPQKARALYKSDLYNTMRVILSNPGFLCNSKPAIDAPTQS